MGKRKTEKVLFWNVDTQNDFMLKDGKLSVPDAGRIVKNLKTLTRLAKEKGIQVVSTCDWHNSATYEISHTPDFKSKFPEHCMENTDGAKFIPETMPDESDSIEVDWDIVNSEEDNVIVAGMRNIILKKDKFDAFEGNPNTDALLRELKPTLVYVYGVASEVCVNFAILGLLKRGYEVVIVIDAIQGLGDAKAVASFIDTWTKMGAKLHTTAQIA